MSLKLYSIISNVIAPCARLLVKYRKAKGKEPCDRYIEKFGIATIDRDELYGGSDDDCGYPAAGNRDNEQEHNIQKHANNLIWIHAASVGEVISVLPFAKELLAGNDNISILLTTSTKSSAEIVHLKLPQYFASDHIVDAVDMSDQCETEKAHLNRRKIAHQFAPIDIARYVTKFLDYWRPSLAIFVESELWPVTIYQLEKYQIPLLILNGRISDNSYRKWLKYSNFASQIFSKIEKIYAQDKISEQKFREICNNIDVNINRPVISNFGNIKYASPPLSYDEEQLSQLQHAVSGRKLILAVSTHEPEEQYLADIYGNLASRCYGSDDLLLIIVPRHAVRGDEIAQQLQRDGFEVAQRGKNQSIRQNTQIYLADTMGELGIFYRLCDFAFIGGSLIAHGGQNPLEPARLDCAVISGCYYHNFTDIYNELASHNAAKIVDDIAGLEQAFELFLQNPALVREYAQKAYMITEQKNNIIADIINDMRELERFPEF